MKIVTPGIPVDENDECPAFDMLNNTFTVTEGEDVQLQFTFRDSNGNPIDLSGPDPLPGDESEPIVQVIVAEASGVQGVPFGVCELPAEDIEINENQMANMGEVLINLPETLRDNSGIYEMSVAYVDSKGKRVNVQKGNIFVERSLFGATRLDPLHVKGPPSFHEIRTHIMDFGSKNTILETVEFSDQDIITAMVKPVHEFNNAPPALLRFRYSTLDFPWRDEWIEATCSYLHQFAAAHYRRNRAETRGPGLTFDDKSREPEYLRAAEIGLRKWREFINFKKVELNASQMFGSFDSTNYYN